jgi:hypothetical protein
MVKKEMPSLADRAGLMRLAERRRVQAAIDRFSASFPGLFFTVYTGTLRKGESLRILGFWLLNRAVFEDVHGLSNDAGIALVIDVERKMAAMSFGYQLDAYLDEEDTFQCLCKAYPYWLEGKYDLGIVALISLTEKILRRKCAQAQRGSRKFTQERTLPQRQSPERTGQSASEQISDGDESRIEEEGIR